MNKEMEGVRDLFKLKRLLMYGIGTQFKECYKIFEDKELILFDGNFKKWGMECQGYIIHSPEEIVKYIDAETGIIITSINNQYEIAKKLVDSFNISDKCIFMYTSKWYEEKIYKLKIIENNWNRIVKIAQNLADIESKKYYINSIMARIERNPFRLVPNSNCLVNGEYANAVKLKKDDCIIDCGAYIGDTAEMYLKRLNEHCKVYAIEPFKNNFNEMKKRIDENNWHDKIEAYNYAVGKTEYLKEFSYNHEDFGMAISLLNTEGKEKQIIKVKTLDQLFLNKKITYIKMDIEGEEKNALEGARKLIQKNCPKLMISGYHKIEDFWEIPETIWSINPQYKIYVGHAPGVSMEVEFYCVIESK